MLPYLRPFLFVTFPATRLDCLDSHILGDRFDCCVEGLW